MKWPSNIRSGSHIRSGSGTSNRILRPVTFVSRLLQYCSSIIVIAIASYFIRDYHQAGEHVYYQEVIATTNAGFFLAPLIFSFWNRLTWHVLPLDLAYSYLWLTAFIFAAEDYNWHSCSAGPPSTLSSCSKKWVLEAFTFLSFIFTVFDVCFQIGIWAHESSNRTYAHDEKSLARSSAVTDNSVTDANAPQMNG